MLKKIKQMDKLTIAQIIAIPVGYATCWTLVFMGANTDGALHTVLFSTISFILIC
jgi:hypothetical protein